MLTTVMAEESAERQGGGTNKRPVIITAFGIHDASYQLQASHHNIKDWYMDQMPQEVFKRNESAPPAWRAAGLAACREATAQFVRAATGASAAGVETAADSPLLSEKDEEEAEVELGGEEEEEGQEEQEEEGRGHGGGRRATRELRERRLQKRRKAEAEAVVPGDAGRGDAAQSNVSVNSSGCDNTEAEVSLSSSTLVDGAVSVGLAPPLVFVLQNNGYYDDPEDFQQMFLEEVHQIQRQEVGIGLSGEAGGNSTLGRVGIQNDDGDILGGSKIGIVDGEGVGVFLVDDSVSLYRKLSCYRIEPSSHYHEPVKIVEGKVLWDLIALVDRESGPALATHDGSDANSSGRVGPAVVAVGISTTVVVLIVVGVAVVKYGKNVNVARWFVEYSSNYGV